MLRDAVFSTYKMAVQTHAKQCPFVQLRKWRTACMPGCVHMPVRPLVLIKNSMAITGFPRLIEEPTKRTRIPWSLVIQGSVSQRGLVLEDIKNAWQVLS